MITITAFLTSYQNTVKKPDIADNRIIERNFRRFLKNQLNKVANIRGIQKDDIYSSVKKIAESPNKQWETLPDEIAFIYLFNSYQNYTSSSINITKKNLSHNDKEKLFLSFYDFLLSLTNLPPKLFGLVSEDCKTTIDSIPKNIFAYTYFTFDLFSFQLIDYINLWEKTISPEIKTYLKDENEIHDLNFIISMYFVTNRKDDLVYLHLLKKLSEYMDIKKKLHSNHYDIGSKLPLSESNSNELLCYFDASINESLYKVTVRHIWEECTEIPDISSIQV